MDGGRPSTVIRNRNLHREVKNGGRSYTTRGDTEKHKREEDFDVQWRK